ncbi:MAG: hypothetical protein HFE77_03165 [Clostridiales bacterium]|nr:hypothetical protein [Clostridiales bacterium]
MTREQQLKELTDIVHDGNYHEEETAEDIYTAGYRKEQYGRWEEERCVIPLSNTLKSFYRCSVCKTHWDSKTRYCPHCGALMDLRQNDRENCCKDYVNGK